MPIKPIKKDSVSKQVFDQIREMIIKGEWKPGSRMPSENELTKMFGVSRISIREALQKLFSLGVIEARQGEGTFVREFLGDLHMNNLIPMLMLQKPDMKSVLEFRRIIEVESAKLAAERAGKEDIEKLEEIYGRMVQAEGDLRKYAADDLDFHFEVARMTGNPLIVKVNIILKDILASFMEDIVTTMGNKKGLYYHEKLLAAIKEKDAQKAGTLMEEHINNTIEFMC